MKKTEIDVTYLEGSRYLINISSEQSGLLQYALSMAHDKACSDIIANKSLIKHNLISKGHVKECQRLEKRLRLLSDTLHQAILNSFKDL